MLTWLTDPRERPRLLRVQALETAAERLLAAGRAVEALPLRSATVQAQHPGQRARTGYSLRSTTAEVTRAQFRAALEAGSASNPPQTSSPPSDSSTPSKTCPPNPPQPSTPRVRTRRYTCKSVSLRLSPTVGWRSKLRERAVTRHLVRIAPHRTKRSSGVLTEVVSLVLLCCRNTGDCLEFSGGVA